MGRASQMVKAIAQERGWRHRSHRHLHEVINALRRETDDPELASLFGGGENLHINFYENWYEVDVIEDHLHQVEQFLDKAEGLLGVTP